jgi:hypothetical protein
MCFDNGYVDFCLRLNDFGKAKLRADFRRGGWPVYGESDVTAVVVVAMGGCLRDSLKLDWLIGLDAVALWATHERHIIHVLPFKVIVASILYRFALAQCLDQRKEFCGVVFVHDL